MRVLVTGSEGQVGWWVRRAVPAGVDLVGLDLKAADPIDVRSAQAAAMAKEADAVLHLAALIDVQASLRDAAQTMSVNVEGTKNLLDAMRPGTRFVFVSSAAVYGDAGAAPVKEDAPLVPISPYGDSKVQGEALVRAAAERRGFDWCIVRPFNIYSSRQDPQSPYTGVVTKFLQAARAGHTLTIHGDGRQTRDFVHARDIADLLWLAVRSPKARSRVINAATGHSVTVRELAEQVLVATGSRSGVAHGPARPGDIVHSAADVAVAHALGWSSRVALSEGLTEVLSGSA